MAQNITILGASYSNVPAVTLPKTGGGTARFTDVSDSTVTESTVLAGYKAYNASGAAIVGTASPTGGITQDENGYLVLPDQSGGGESWSWMGNNPTKMDEWTEHLTFDEVGAGSWTWGTTAAVLRNSSQAYTPPISITLDLEEYDYYFVMRSFVHYDYGEWEPKSAITAMASCVINLVYGTLGNLEAFETGVPSAHSVLYPGPNSLYCYYANAAGVKTYANQSSYGVVVGANINTSVNSSTSVSPTYTFNEQAISIRGSNVYFNSTAYSNVDFENSYITIAFEIWRVDSGTTPPSKCYAMLAEALNDGLGGE